MNEVVPDWLHREDTTRASGTALPNTIIGIDNKELNALRTTVALLQDENRALKAENAELREKCMTRFARIKNAANADDMAQMLHKIYCTGMADAHPANIHPTWSGINDMAGWLLEVGTI